MRPLLAAVTLCALLLTSRAAAADSPPDRAELEQRRAQLVWARGLSVAGLAAGGLIVGAGYYFVDRSDREVEGDTCFDCIGDLFGGLALATVGASLAAASAVALAVSQVGINRLDLQIGVVPGSRPGLSLSGRF